MIYLAIVFFALAAVLGLIILKNWLTSSDTPKSVIYSHGIFAAIALIVLLIQVIKQPENSLKTSLALFVVAAIGGFYMFFRDLKGKMSPTWLAIVHGLIAVAGFVSLVLFVI